MDYLTDLDEYAAAMRKVDFSKDLNATKTGGFLMESLELECYNKCQSILDCPEMGAAHKYCLDVDFDDLRQDIIDKINKLYQLGAERGFLKPYDDEGGEDEEDFDPEEDGGFQGETRDVGDGSEMYDTDQSVYESRLKRKMMERRMMEQEMADDAIDQVDAPSTEQDVAPDTTADQSEPSDDVSTQDDQVVPDLGDAGSDVEGGTEDVQGDGDPIAAEDPSGEDGGDITDIDGEDSVDQDSAEDSVEEEPEELDAETKETRRNEFTELFRTTLNQFFKDKEANGDGVEENEQDTRDVKHMTPSERAEFWKKIADGWEGKEDPSMFFDDFAEEFDALEEETPDGTEEDEGSDDETADSDDDEGVEDGSEEEGDETEDSSDGSEEDGEDSESENSEESDGEAEDGDGESETDDSSDEETETDGE